MIKERTSNIREFIKGLITKEMSTEEISKCESMISELDEMDKEEDSYQSEISSCKDKIVSLVKSQGNDTPPQEEKKPRTLEEISNDLFGGK